MMREDQLVLGKLKLALKFAGVLVGSAVLTGKEIVGFGAECGKKAVNFCESSAAAVGKFWRRGVPTRTRIADGLAEGGPGGIAPVQTAVAAPTAIETEPATEPVTPGEKARVQQTAQPKAPVEQPAQPDTAVEEAPTALPAKPDTDPIKAKGPEPEVSHDKEPNYREVTSEDIEAGAFTGAVQKVLLERALSNLADEDVGTRAHAAKAIGDIRNELSVRALAAHAFREEAAHVRKECINALRTLDMQEALPAVEYALNDSSASVRAAAVRGVYRLRGVESTSTLTRVLSDESAEVRRMVATCLGWLGQEHHAVDLVPLFTDEAAPVRQAAVEAVGNLGSRQVVFTLIECLNDSDESVRKKVLGVIERITGNKLSDDYPEDDDERQRLIARWRYWWNEESKR
jgi:hypothetical protein